MRHSELADVVACVCVVALNGIESRALHDRDRMCMPFNY